MINQELPDSKVDQQLVEQVELENQGLDELENIPNDNIETQVDVEKQNEEQIKNVLLGILEEESAFDKALEGSNLLELTLLMEVIANHSNIKLNATRVGILKRTFDEKYQNELASIKNEFESDPEHAKKHKQIFETYSNRFSVALAKFNKKRSEFEKELEAEKAAKIQRKKELLENLIKIVNEDRFDAIDEVRSIQAEWKSIGHVVHEESEHLLSKYKAYLDNFYDKRSRFKELVELDHQTHLKEKQALIDSVIALTPTDEQIKDKDGTFWKEASEKIKIYQEEWKVIGNVPLDQKEYINNRFKEVVDNFYTQRKKYYEILDTQRLINAKLKLDLLDKLKPFGEFQTDDLNEWKKKSEELKELQAKWKEIGPAPSNQDTELWNQFRNYCKIFYSNKSNFFAKLDKQREEILKQKLELCAKAEEVANSEDFKNGTNIIKELQKKWKEIDVLTHVDYYKVLRRFRKACDSYFKKKIQSLNLQKKQEEENLVNKKAIISRIHEIIEQGEWEESVNEVRELQEKWKNIGTVPLKAKASINKEFRDACDLFFQKLRSKPKKFTTKTTTSSSSLKSNVTSKNRTVKSNLDIRDIRKIKAKIADLEAQIEQYETNILFFAKGKSTEKIIAEYTKKIEEAKATKNELEAKLKSIFEKKEIPSKKEDTSADSTNE